LYGTTETDTGVWSGVLGPYREGQVRALNWVQKRAAEFAININESGWETLAQGRLKDQICALFKAYTGGRAWKARGDGLLKPFLFNNQPYAQIIQIYSVIKPLHVSGIFSAHHQECPTVHLALVSFMQVFDDRFQAESG
jgi:hypothetical protein